MFYFEKRIIFNQFLIERQIYRSLLSLQIENMNVPMDKQRRLRKLVVHKKALLPSDWYAATDRLPGRSRVELHN